MDATAAVAFDRAGHLIVLTRSMEAFYEFDPNGMFVRSFGGNMFTRAHGIKVDRARQHLGHRRRRAHWCTRWTAPARCC